MSHLNIILYFCSFGLYQELFADKGQKWYSSLLQDEHTFKRQEHNCMTVRTKGRRGNGTDTNVLDSVRLSFLHRGHGPSFISALVSYLSGFFLRTQL